MVPIPSGEVYRENVPLTFPAPATKLNSSSFMAKQPTGLSFGAPQFLHRSWKLASYWAVIELFDLILEAENVQKWQNNTEHAVHSTATNDP